MFLLQQPAVFFTLIYMTVKLQRHGVFSSRQILSCRQGGKDMKCDAKKFAQMYEEIYKDLYRFALCRMRNVQDAEDAVSESVLAAYENIRQLQKEAAFKSWMFTILANTCRRRLKESGNRQRQEDGEIKELAEHSAKTPDYGMALDVKKAFLVLSPEEQEIVALSVFGGYSSREIGSALKLNPNTVRSKRSRALEKMEEILE